MKLETVKIVAYGKFKKNHDYLLINKSVYEENPDEYVLWEDRNKKVKVTEEKKKPGPKPKIEEVKT